MSSLNCIETGKEITSCKEAANFVCKLRVGCFIDECTECKGHICRETEVFLTVL